MRLSSKGRYGIGAMLHLAVHNEAGPVPLAEVSVCQGISLSYIDQIFSKLRRAELIQGTPGPGGGYRLARPAETISVGDVLAAVEGESRRRGAQSELELAVWEGLAAELDGFLRGISLRELVDRPNVREAFSRQYQVSPWRCEVCGVLSQRQPEGGAGYPAG